MINKVFREESLGLHGHQRGKRKKSREARFQNYSAFQLGSIYVPSSVCNLTPSIKLGN